MTAPRIASDQRGQMTIFIALIFQVLFVFFAMIINVGLIVHDKINLQNSVDLAAYYGAQRQAEMLDAIAHENYQIRQAWKLLSWRLRVLGDMANKNNPLSNFDPNSPGAMDLSLNDAALAADQFPVVCINHKAWGPDQNVCHEYANDIHIPPVPIIPVIAAFLPWNIIANDRSKDLRASAGSDCNATGPMNFTMASLWMGAYRSQVAQAKKAIRIYAANLANGLDIRGESIAKGVSNTLMNNLTRANKNSLNPNTDLTLFNSINGMPIQSWLHEVAIRPTIYYADLHDNGGCNGEAKTLPNVPTSSPNISSDLIRMGEESGDPNEPTNSSFGYEKNPWVMVYYGVSAHASPRKPYLPFGDAIQLTAKAFAKPFGGRIGPWYYNQWPASSNKSSGNFAQRTDAQVPIDSDEAPTSNNPDPSIANFQIPNYSRYPGDQLGLKSRAGILAFAKTLLQKIIITQINQASYSYTPSGSDGLAYAMPGSNLNTDTTLGYAAPWIRAFEVAAVAPDLFDVTYYSIDPNFYFDYIKGAGDRFIPAQQIPADIGSFPTGGFYAYSVAKQIALATQGPASADPSAFWIIKNWQNLLTGWSPSGAFEYDFPSTFGKCSAPATSVPVPGACAQGGRVGYSVKIVSQQYLQSSNLPLGGQGISGAIQNPPPSGF